MEIDKTLQRRPVNLNANISNEKELKAYESQLSAIEGKLQTPEGQRKVEQINLEAQDRTFLEGFAREDVSVLGIPLNSRNSLIMQKGILENRIAELEKEIKGLQKMPTIDTDQKADETTFTKLGATFHSQGERLKLARDNLEKAKKNLEILNKGIRLGIRAIKLLQQAEPTGEATGGLKKVVKDYKSAVTDLIKANDKFFEANKKLEKAKEDAGAWFMGAEKKQVTQDALQTAQAEYDNAQKDLEKKKGYAQEMRKDVRKNLQNVAENFSLKDIRETINRNNKAIKELDSSTTIAKLKTKGTVNLATMKTTAEKYEKLEQVFVRYRTMLDNPAETLEPHHKEIQRDYEKAKAWVQDWGASTSEIETMLESIAEEKGSAGKATMGPKPAPGTENTESILQTAKDLQAIDETFRNIASLENFKRENEESMWFARILAIVSVISLVGIPIAIISGLFLAAYTSKEKAAEDALIQIKGSLGVVANSTDNLVREFVEINDTDTEFLPM